eukprot:4662465-Amphidinium_carterae.1
MTCEAEAVNVSSVEFSNTLGSPVNCDPPTLQTRSSVGRQEVLSKHGLLQTCTKPGEFVE